MFVSAQCKWLLAILLAIGMGAVAASFPLVAAALAVFVGLLFLILGKPVIGLAMAVLAYPYISRNSVLLSGLPIKTFLDMALMALCGIWGILVLIKKSPVRFTGLSVWMVLYFTVTALSALLNDKTPVEALTIVKYLFYFFLVANLIGWESLPVIAWALVGGGIVLGLDGIYQSFTHESSWVLRLLINLGIYTPDTVSLRVYENIVGSARAVSTFPTSNTFAGFLLFVIPVAITLAFYIRTKWAAVFAWGGVLILTWSLVVTQSRGGLLGFAISVLFLLANVGIHHRRPLLNFGAASLVMFGLLASLGYFGRLDSLIDINYATNLERLSRWSAGLALLERSPWFGVGPGQYREAYMQFAPVGAPLEAMDSHNLYLQIAVETGMLGFSAFLAAFVGGLYFVSRKALALAPDHRHRTLVTGFVAAMVAYLTHGLVDYVTSLPEISFQVWLFAGILTGLASTKLGKQIEPASITRERYT